MDIKTALSLIPDTDKDLKRRIQLILNSHGLKDHSQDIQGLIGAFIQDATKFASKEAMPQEWKSYSAYAKAFEALALFVHIDRMKQHLTSIFGTEQFTLVKNKFLELKKMYDRLAKDESKKKKKQTINTQLADETDIVIQTESPPPSQSHSDTSSESETEPESEADSDVIQTDGLMEFDAEDMTRFFKAYDCAMKYIWALAVAEQDTIKSLTIKHLYKSIRQIEPQCTRKFYPSS